MSSRYLVRLPLPSPLPPSPQTGMKSNCKSSVWMHGPSPWETWTFKGRSEVNICNGSGIRDPQFEVLQGETTRTDRKNTTGVTRGRREDCLRLSIIIIIIAAFIYSNIYYMSMHIYILIHHNLCCYSITLIIIIIILSRRKDWLILSWRYELHLLAHAFLAASKGEQPYHPNDIITLPPLNSKSRLPSRRLSREDRGGIANGGIAKSVRIVTFQGTNMLYCLLFKWVCEVVS